MINLKKYWRQINIRRNRYIVQIIIFVVTFVFVLFSGFYVFFYKIMPEGSRVRLLRSNPVLIKLLPVFRGIRKIGDITYLPYYFQKNDLPVYELEIKDEDIKKMLNSLPEGFTEEIYTNKVYVPAKLNFNDKEYKVEVRIRGDNSLHWEADKKSYLIKFKNDDLLEGGVKRLSFILPDDRKFAVEQFNNYRADKLGLMHPESGFGNLIINGKNNGLYFLIENWSSEMVAKWGVPDASNFYGGDYSSEWIDGEFKDFIWDDIGMWEKLAEDDRFNFKHFSEIYKLIDLVNNGSDKEFNDSIFNLIDRENFIDWLVHQNLSASTHQTGGNLRTYFNNATGKFYFIPWDVDNFKPIENIDAFYNKLVSRVLSNPEFVYERNKRLWNYLDDKDNLKRDLEKYDEIYNNIKVALYKDRAKIYTNRWADALYEERRNFIIDNFNYLKEILKGGKATVEVITSDKPNILATINVQVNNLSELFLDGLDYESIDSGFIFNDYDLFYDYNDNGYLDDGDKIVDDNYNPPLYSRKKITETLYKIYNIEFTNHRFFLVSNITNKDDFQKNLSYLKLNLSNAVTGKKIKKDDIRIKIVNSSIFSDFTKINNINDFILSAPFFRVDEYNKNIVLLSGTYNINNNIIIPTGYNVSITAGTTLRFAPGVSLISYSPVIAEGTEVNPITFTIQDKTKNWGNVFVLNNKEDNVFENCIFEYGGDSYANGAYASGMLAFHDTGNVLVKDSTFRYASGDDALNVKWGKALIQNNIFEKNGFDAIDLDWGTGGIIENNRFIDNGNDAMDIGGGKDIMVKNNFVEKSGDKCISIGENTQNITVFNNILTNCVIGVAIKDKSNAKIINNTILNNETGISLYEKKPVWGGAAAEAYNNIVWQEGDSVYVDSKSEIKIENSDIKNGYSGKSNINIEPVFDKEFKLINSLIKGNREYLEEEGIDIKVEEIPIGKIF